jgi:hypothetical protein
MKTRTYNRSEIYSFYDLTEKEQAEVISNYFSSIEEAEEDSFIRCGKEVLPLSMFLKCENSIWSGTYGTSYFSGYYIKINKFGDEVVIADKYW